MHFLRKRLDLVSVFALLVACAFSSACTAWHTTSLQPQRFSADSSPERTRLTLNDGRRLTAAHPVLVGDSLVWTNGTGSAVLASDVRKVEVRRSDATRTVVLAVAIVGGLVGGFIAYSRALAASID